MAHFQLEKRGAGAPIGIDKSRRAALGAAPAQGSHALELIPQGLEDFTAQAQVFLFVRIAGGRTAGENSIGGVGEEGFSDGRELAPRKGGEFFRTATLLPPKLPWKFQPVAGEPGLGCYGLHKDQGLSFVPVAVFEADDSGIVQGGQGPDARAFVPGGQAPVEFLEDLEAQGNIDVLSFHVGAQDVRYFMHSPRSRAGRPRWPPPEVIRNSPEPASPVAQPGISACGESSFARTYA